MCFHTSFLLFTSTRSFAPVALKRLQMLRNDTLPSGAILSGGQKPFSNSRLLRLHLGSRAGSANTASLSDNTIDLLTEVQPARARGRHQLTVEPMPFPAPHQRPAHDPLLP